MSNAAYEIDEQRDELIDGKIVAMSPRPTLNHNSIAGNIYLLFRTFLRGKSCKAYGDGVDLYLTPTDRFVPDGMIVCDHSMIQFDGIHGAPDLVVEVLSPTTAKNDRWHKKAVYEKSGVKEYWLVDPANRAVEVYLLRSGVFVLDNIHTLLPDYLIAKMNEKEKAALKVTFQCSLFPDMTISLADVFEGML